MFHLIFVPWPHTNSDRVSHHVRRILYRTVNFNL